MSSTTFGIVVVVEGRLPVVDPDCAVVATDVDVEVGGKEVTKDVLVLELELVACTVEIDGDEVGIFAVVVGLEVETWQVQFWHDING